MAMCTAYHEQHAEVAAGDPAQVGFWTGRVDVASLVEQVLDRLVGVEDHHDLGAEDEREDGSVFLCPLLELYVDILAGHEMEVAD